MIDVSLTRAQFVQLVRILDQEKTQLGSARQYAKKHPEGDDPNRYDREYYDVSALLAAVLEEDADADEYESM